MKKIKLDRNDSDHSELEDKVITSEFFTEDGQLFRIDSWGHQLSESMKELARALSKHSLVRKDDPKWKIVTQTIEDIMPKDDDKGSGIVPQITDETTAKGNNKKND